MVKICSQHLDLFACKFNNCFFLHQKCLADFLKYELTNTVGQSWRFDISPMLSFSIRAYGVLHVLVSLRIEANYPQFGCIKTSTLGASAVA